MTTAAHLHIYVDMRHVGERDIRQRPLTEPVLLILMSLAGGPRHGYALLKDIPVISGGRVRLSTGTLYEALRRLLGDGAIERVEQSDTSREKHFYRLTAVGDQLLAHDIERMKQLTRSAARLRITEVHS